MKILVTGSRGLVGRALVRFLNVAGHPVVRLVRAGGTAQERDVIWDPVAGTIDRSKLVGLDAVVHLAGEKIFWPLDPSKKARIRDSRVHLTQLLCESLAQISPMPRVLVSASAVGFYGNRGNEILNEDSPGGDSFLASICREWEAATLPAANAGMRVVRLRSGVVLTPAGGALAMMLPPFRLGLGGRVGSGKQYLSWITLDDLLEVIGWTLTTEELRGPVNAVAPFPVNNAEFARTLGLALARPTLLPVPAFAARLVFGEMAQDLLLASARVEPAKLMATGFRFKYPGLGGALRHLLGKAG